MGKVEGKLGRGIVVTARVWVSGAAVAFAMAARALGCGGDASESLGDRSDAAVTGAASPAADAGPGSDAGASTSGTAPAIKVVFVVAMENEDARIYDDAARFPFLHDVLLGQAARATAFADPLARETPSQPHYIWMEAGTNTLPDHTFHDNSPPSAENSTASGEHLVAQIAAAGNGADWMSYQEGIDAESGACPVASSGLYRPRHNPFVFFHDVAGSPPSKTAPVCIAHHKPLSALAGDLAAGAVKAYNFISPDLCHDGHGAPGCPKHGGVSPGDAWMREALPPLIAFVNAHDGVLFIVWDEGATSAVIPFLALGPHVKAGYAGGVPYDHRSLVKSIEKILGLPFLPAVAAANDFGDLFEPGFFP